MLLDLFLKSPVVVGITVSLLMILDIQFTRIGYQFSQKGYNDHFVQPVYELNPRYQRLIHQEEQIPLRLYLERIAFGIVIGGFVFIVNSSIITFLGLEEFFFNGTEFVVGAFTFLFLGLNLGHVNNIFIFRYIKNNPNAIQGKIIIDQEYTYLLTRRNYLTLSILLLVVYFLVGRLFFLGGGVEFFVLVLISFYWQRKSSEKKTQK